MGDDGRLLACSLCAIQFASACEVTSLLRAVSSAFWSSSSRRARSSSAARLFARASASLARCAASALCRRRLRCCACKRMAASRRSRPASRDSVSTRNRTCHVSPREHATCEHGVVRRERRHPQPHLVSVLGEAVRACTRAHDLVV